MDQTNNIKCLDRPQRPDSHQQFPSPVSHHTQITGPTSWNLLLWGIDKLDITLSVEWGSAWADFGQQLREGREAAEGTPGVVRERGKAGQFILTPGSGNMNYSYHLRFEWCRFYVKDVAQPNGIPNVLACINAETLWRESPAQAVKMVRMLIENLGGRVTGMKPSRIDLSADFQLTGKLDFQFLQTHKVSRSKEISLYATGDAISSFYVGAKSAPVKARFYAKGRQVEAQRDAAGFKELWRVEDARSVWRLEFQLRRQFLRDREIDSVENLLQNLGSLWRYLSCEWLSFRLPDNPVVTRRSIHPWWRAVQDASEHFGPAGHLHRKLRRSHGQPIVWQVHHVAGCIESYAARLGIRTPDEALDAMTRALTEVWEKHDFQARVSKKSIKLGLVPPRKAPHNPQSVPRTTMRDLQPLELRQ